MTPRLLGDQLGPAVRSGMLGSLALIAATVAATVVVLSLGWIAVMAANATLGRHEYPNSTPYDLSDAWTQSGAP